jgi:hypothetical protein
MSGQVLTRSAPRSPDKAAIDYRIASGAVAITVIEADGICTISIGTKVKANAISVQWIRRAAGAVDRYAGPPRCWP